MSPWAAPADGVLAWDQPQVFRTPCRLAEARASPAGTVKRMTGGEIVPVAKVAASVAKKAVDDKDDKTALQELAAESPIMKAAAESYARRVVIKQAVLLRIYQPLARFLGVSRNYFDTEFHEDMAKKLADIPEEHLATPSPSVAIPAMQGLSYSVEEPNLKEMYLNLLATATDDRMKEKAHPSFAEIIKQLSPGEASLLLDTLHRRFLPVVQLRRKAEEGGGSVIVRNHLLPVVDDNTGEPVEESSLPVWIDNWIRLGLIEVDYAAYMTAEGGYAWVEGRPEFVRLEQGDPRGKDGVDVERGLLRATDFGAQFLAAVSYDGVSLSGAPGVVESPGRDTGNS